MRLSRGALGPWSVLAAMAMMSCLCVLPAAGQGEANDRPNAAQENPFSAITMYQGRVVHEIGFKGLTSADAGRLRKLIAQREGQPLDRNLIRQSIVTLDATRRFSDIRAEAEREPSGSVNVWFVTEPNYFVGQVRSIGNPNRPNSNQVVNASKLVLGTRFIQADLDRALANVQQLLRDNGYYRAEVKAQTTPHSDRQQMDVNFIMDPGPLARVGEVSVTGDPGYSKGQVEDMAKFHPGDEVSVQRTSNALDRLRKKYQKQSRLVAQISVPNRIYRPGTNTVDYTFNIQPGPKVDIIVEGFKLSRRELRKAVPVFQENTLDEDLLNEGRRNLLTYLQTHGYFDATVGIKQHNEVGGDLLRAIYIVDPGERHKLAKVVLEGNHYFPSDLILPRMQIQPAGRLFSHGRFNQGLLADDVRGIEDLYRNNGFQHVKVTSKVQDNYEGETNQLEVEIHIGEGPQTTVSSLTITGNHVMGLHDFPELSTAPGQPFSETNIASDRDALLDFYFNHGFPSATFEATAKPMVSDPECMNVTFTIHEGEQVFVDQVYVSGLRYTRPATADQQLEIHPGDPVSQIEMLRTQQKLYDLGIFSQVETAVQNPEGKEPSKNVLVDVQEAKRYTFNYGLGLEFQTGQPAVGSNQPLGATGVSPRVSFDVTRLNFRGRANTLTLKSNLGRLQQRGLISYDAPRWLNSQNWHLSLTAFYDNTLDVTTFTSQRLEASVQFQQTVSRATSLFYRYTFRRVKASDIEISPDQIPLLSQPTRVGGPGLSFIRDKRDNPLETTRGTYNTIDEALADTHFGSEADFSRILLQNSTYHAFGRRRPDNRRYVFARSTRIGVEVPYGSTVIVEPGDQVPDNSSLVPLPERFFSGGGNSHRGFGLNQAGPRDPNTGFPLGGSALFLNNLELRFPPVNLPFFEDNLSFAIFHDAGNVFTKASDLVDSLGHWTQQNPELCNNSAMRDQCNYNYVSQAIGVGIRYRTPIGPVRFDFGYNLNPPDFPSCQSTASSSGQSASADCPSTTPYFVPQKVGHFNVYFSIGQTF